MRLLVTRRRGKLTGPGRAAGVLLAAAAAAGFAGVFWAGTASQPDGYDPALTYPSRSDVIVLQPPAETPPSATPVGNLAATLAGYARLSGARLVQPDALDEPTRAVIAQALAARFGTPAAPLVPPDAAFGDISLSPAALAEGSRAYRRLCSQCHGLEGNGQGNAGEWMHPFPRDFRRGLFKVAAAGGKPRPDELRRVLRQGVPGTRMQAYDVIPDAELDAVIGYVVHLSQRSEAELRAVVEMAGGDGDPAEAAQVTGDAAAAVGRDWAEGGVGPAARGGDAARGRRRPPPRAGAVRPELPRLSRWVRPRGVVPLRRLGRGRPRHRPDGGRVEVGQVAGTGGRPHPQRHSGREYACEPGLTDAETLDLAAFILAVSRPDLLPGDVRHAVDPDFSGE